MENRIGLGSIKQLCRVMISWLKQHPAFFSLITIECLFFTLGISSFEGRKHGDEELHLRVIEQTLAAGNWWTPILDGKPFFNKPPLLFWLTFITHFGINNVRTAGRLVVLFFSLLSTTFIYLLALKTHESKANAFGATVVYSSTLGYFYFSRLAMLDIPLVASLLAIIYFGWKFCEEKKSKFFYGVCLFICIGMQWKGPVFFGLCFPAFLIFFLERKVGLRDLLPYWKAVLITVLISISWQLGMSLKYGKEFIDYFYFNQSLDRINAFAPTKLIFFILLALLPWTFYIVPALLDWKLLKKFESRLALALVLGNVITYLKVGDPHFHWMLPAVAGFCFYPWLESKSLITRTLQWLLGTPALFFTFTILFGLEALFFIYANDFLNPLSWFGLGASIFAFSILLAPLGSRFVVFGGIPYLISISIIYYGVLPIVLSPLRLPKGAQARIGNESPHFLVKSVDQGIYYVGEFGSTKNVVNIDDLGGKKPKFPDGSIVVVRTELLGNVVQPYRVLERWTKFRDGLTPVNQEVADLWSEPSLAHWTSLVEKISDPMVMVRIHSQE